MSFGLLERFADLVMELSFGDGFADLMQFIHCCNGGLEPLLMEFWTELLEISFVIDALRV
ncbi:hypothetical protein RchiOBHm_Chr2g0147581 [Rosa chinensis]|uniref:Uncharacterized protein n=1 Tax=Rosa chinensis TaxID=74649 RepID=A0A2P6RZ56_ROSCH|nr:hypothetical protein RchiOBHm_Chr2g0147581 [Rosa chinensis]